MLSQRDPQRAFADAIERGKLSAKPEGEPATTEPPYRRAVPYAGDYMYMGTERRADGRETVYTDLFKHRDTREYLRVESLRTEG